MDTNQSEEALELLRGIDKKLAHLIGIVSTSGKSKEEQVATLVGLGFSNSEISRITGIPKGTVDWIRASAKSSAKKRGPAMTKDT